MRQVLQNLRTGEIEVAEVPCPLVRPGHLLLQTTRSLISAGTERSLVEFAQASLIGKARAQPERIRQVLDKIRTDGLLPTLEAVFSRLDEPLPLGYCNVGRVVEVGRDVSGFRVRDLVASNGPHAEMVHVPVMLAARVPEGVEDEAAAFAALGAVALHAVRLAEPTFGEHFVVMGLGLVGLLAAQFLRAHGCHVIGIDPHARRCELARGFGCVAVSPEEDDPVEAAIRFSEGRGTDGVLIAASASTDDIVHQAAQMCRKRGRIVLVGVVGLDLRRRDFYEKELTFQVSCSYGPGRYDPAYEIAGRDYPIPYVRWTAARNFESVLAALADRRVDVGPLISHRIPQTRAKQAYGEILTDPAALGVVLTYPQQSPPVGRSVIVHVKDAATSPACSPVVGVIGTGNFATRVLLPAIRAAGASIECAASATGVTGLRAARKFGIARTTTDHREVLADPRINVVFIATRHANHADLVVEALESGKHVFVEKPLAIDEDGLRRVRLATNAHRDLQLMVGFNRRFAPHAVAIQRRLVGRSQPISVRVMVNAGEMPADHWVNNPAIGGGRVIGEACHFIDLLRFLVGHPISSVQAIAADPGRQAVVDTISICLGFSDGSMGVVDYWCNGPRSYPKEQVEVFSEGRAVVIENWRRLRAFGWPGMPTMRTRQNKGHTQEVLAFLQRVDQGGDSLIPFDELEQVTQATLGAVQAVQVGAAVSTPRFSAPVPTGKPSTVHA